MLGIPGLSADTITKTYDLTVSYSSSGPVSHELEIEPFDNRLFILDEIQINITSSGAGSQVFSVDQCEWIPGEYRNCIWAQFDLYLQVTLDESRAADEDYFASEGWGAIDLSPPLPDQVSYTPSSEDGGYESYLYGRGNNPLPAFADSLTILSKATSWNLKPFTGQIESQVTLIYDFYRPLIHLDWSDFGSSLANTQFQINGVMVESNEFANIDVMDVPWDRDPEFPKDIVWVSEGGELVPVEFGPIDILGLFDENGYGSAYYEIDRYPLMTLARDQFGEPIRNTEFRINGVMTQTDADGFLQLAEVPVERDPEYPLDTVWLIKEGYPDGIDYQFEALDVEQADNWNEVYLYVLPKEPVKLLSSEGETLAWETFEINGVYLFSDENGVIDFFDIPRERVAGYPVDRHDRWVEDEYKPLYFGPVDEEDIEEAVELGIYVVHPNLPLYVLSIGIDYDDIRPVPEFEDTLKSGYMAEQFKEIFDWSPAYPSHVSSRLLKLDPNASPETNRVRINDAINNFVDEIEEESIFILFMSGHGGTNFSSDEPPVEVQIDVTNLDTRLEDTGDEGLILKGEEKYYDDELVAQFQKDAKWDTIYKVFIIDACFAGGFWPDLKVLPNSLFFGASPESDFSVATIDPVASLRFLKVVYTGTFARAVVSAFSLLEEFKGLDSFDTIRNIIKDEHRQFAGNIGRVQRAPYLEFPDVDIVVGNSPIFRYTEDVRVEAIPKIDSRAGAGNAAMTLDWATNWLLQRSTDLSNWEDLSGVEPPYDIPFAEEDFFFRLVQPADPLDP